MTRWVDHYSIFGHLQQWQNCPISILVRIGSKYCQIINKYFEKFPKTCRNLSKNVEFSPNLVTLGWSWGFNVTYLGTYKYCSQRSQHCSPTRANTWEGWAEEEKRRFECVHKVWMVHHEMEKAFSNQIRVVHFCTCASVFHSIVGAQNRFVIFA